MLSCALVVAQLLLGMVWFRSKTKRAAGLPAGLLWRDADHAPWQTRSTGSAEPRWAVLDQAGRTVSALGGALVAVLAEMYVQGVLTRKVKGDDRGAVRP
jgi:hypothetical protein